MSSNNRTFYKFKGFQLDVAERLLQRNELPVALSPKTFDLLALIVERSGRLVEKDELLRVVWENAFVEEANVSRVIHSLRKILGEDAQNKFIETVSKKGYRFVAEVELSNGSNPPEKDKEKIHPPQGNGFNHISPNNGDLGNAETENDGSALRQIDAIPQQTLEITQNENAHPVSRNLKSVFWAALLILVVLSIAFGAYTIFAPRNIIANSTGRSLAVLPLRPINKENRDPIYELGIAESLILKLNSAKQLTVRPLSAIRKYQNLDENPVEEGKEQQVDFVLSSNYQIVGDRIRVTSQLINVQTGQVEEVFTSENNPSNVFLMQDSIARDISSTLLVRFGTNENTLTSARGTSNEEAYRLYLQAAFIFDQWNKTDAAKAVGYLERAVALDPNYAQAYVMLAYAYRFFPYTNVASPAEQASRAKTAIEKALALDANSADAHAVNALIKFSYDRDFAGAEKEYKRAIELNPNSITAHALYAYYLMIPGRFEESAAENQKAITLDPAAFANQITQGMLLYYSHRYDEGIAHYQRLLEKDKNFVYGYFWMWLLCDLQGNEVQAYEWFMKYQTQIKANPETLAAYQNAYQKSGWKGILQEIITQDEKRISADNNTALFYEVACMNARLGNTDKAFEYLEKSYESHNSSLVFIKVDPYLESLRDDPRFTQLINRLGLNQ